MDNFIENKNNADEKKDTVITFKTTFIEKGEIKKMLNTIPGKTVSEKILKGLRLLYMQNSTKRELQVYGMLRGKELKLVVDGVSISLWKIKDENFNDYTGVLKLDAFRNLYKIYVKNGNVEKVIENEKVMYGSANVKIDMPTKPENFQKIIFEEIKNNSTDVANMTDFHEEIMKIKTNLIHGNSKLMNEFVNLISNVDSFTRKEFNDKLKIFQNKI
jgi:hypothetical protein